MIFKKLNMEDAAFDQDSMNDLKALLIENCEMRPNTGPMSDLVKNLPNNASIQSSSL
jgi:hypothetical protein